MDKKRVLKPFFSKFLEGELTKRELMSPIAGRTPPITHKYPSDLDEVEPEYGEGQGRKKKRHP